MELYDTIRDNDPIIKAVLRNILQTNAVSASNIQRKFKVGYNNAARIIDYLEAKRYIGPLDGVRPREIFFTADMYREKYGEDPFSDCNEANTNSTIEIPIDDSKKEGKPQTEDPNHSDLNTVIQFANMISKQMEQEEAPDPTDGESLREITDGKSLSEILDMVNKCKEHYDEAVRIASKVIDYLSMFSFEDDKPYVDEDPLDDN